MKTKTTRGGFTLIELLIVVAIIAILAAIAVPNFLEAQTRAKVSKIKADMRTLVTALESYSVDNNKWLPDRFDWQRETGGQPHHWDWVMIPLTTPIAYIATIPVDNFTKMADIGGIHTWYLTRSGYGTASYHNQSDGAAFFSLQRARFNWCLVSPGPDRYWEWDRGNAGAGNYFGDVVYFDPTNGTKSQGDLYYFGSGGGYNPPPSPKQGKT